MNTVHEFRVWCNTDNKYETSYGPVEPTKCPIESYHSIDISKTVIENTINPNTITINEYNTSLGGFFKAKGELMDIPANTKIVGKTTNILGVSDTVIEVDDDAINYVSLDDRVKIRHGDIESYLGQIIVIDKKNKQLTFKDGTSDIEFAAGSDILDITTTKDFIQPIDIGVLSYSYISTIDHMGDELEVQVYPNKLVGAITNFVKAGDTIINVSPTVIQYIKKGIYCRIDDGVVIECLGIVTNVDVANKQISVEKPAMNDYSPFGPSLIKMTVKMLESGDIGPAGRHIEGKDKIGSSIIYKGNPVRVLYTNRTGSKKRLCFTVGYIY